MMINYMDTMICLDIDGTITEDRSSVSREVREYLRELSLKGYTIFLETGRCFTFASQTLRELDFPFYIAAQNGSVVLKMPEKIEVFSRYLDQSAFPFIEKVYEGVDSDYLVYSGYDKGDFCYYRKSRFSKDSLSYIEDLQVREGTTWKEVLNFDEIGSSPLVKGFGSKKQMEQLKNEFLQKDQFQVSLNQDPFDENIQLLLITHKMASKGFALDALKSKLGIKRVIAAGDDDNDISMLERADVKIVIDSAPENLKKIADLICPGPKELGILTALKEVL